jgi:hypothetical protein
MSSHHFVKENQEPALLIWEVKNIDFDKISSLLEWVPLVLVHEDAVETVLSWGIKIDKIVCNEEYASEHQYLLEEHYPLVFVAYEQNIELEDVLLHLVEVNQKAVNILGVAPIELPVYHEVLLSLDVVLFEKSRRHLLINKNPLKKWFVPCVVWLQVVDKHEVKMHDFQSQTTRCFKETTKVDLEEGFYQFESSAPFWLTELY